MAQAVAEVAVMRLVAQAVAAEHPSAEEAQEVAAVASRVSHEHRAPEAAEAAGHLHQRGWQRR